MKKILVYFKELLWMASRLFSAVPADNKLSLRRSEFFPGKDYAYLMWCGVLIYREERLSKIDSVSLNHERIHLCQARAKGSWLRYYWSYLWQLMKGWGFGGPKMAAYYTNPYEMEAYANERVMGYCSFYKPLNMKRYFVNNRRKVFEENRGSWRRFLYDLSREGLVEK